MFKLTITIAAFLFLTSCQEFLYPADDHLELPGGEEMRLHCTSECPDKDLILKQMKDLSDNCLKDYPGATYPQWRHFALTWSDIPWYREDGAQILGATYHNRKAIYVYYPTERVESVVKWELLMAALENLLPYEGELAKIEWQLQNCQDF